MRKTKVKPTPIPPLSYASPLGVGWEPRVPGTMGLAKLVWEGGEVHSLGIGCQAYPLGDVTRERLWDIALARTNTDRTALLMYDRLLRVCREALAIMGGPGFGTPACLSESELPKVLALRRKFKRQKARRG